MINKIGRYVLTGGPSCGKTSIIEALDIKGYKTVPESARVILNSEKADGDAFGWNTEKQIFIVQSEVEDVAFKFSQERMFLDRSLVDAFAYSRHFFGKLPKLFENFNLRKRYDLVFMLDLLPFHNDGVRIEKDDVEALGVHRTIEQEYLRNGYNPIHVPVLPGADVKQGIERRIEFILREVADYESRA